MNFAQRVYVSSDHCLIDFVTRGCTGAVEADVQIDAAAGQARTDAFAKIHLHRVQLLRRAQVNVEITIVDGLDLDADGKTIAGCRASSEAGH